MWRRYLMPLTTSVDDLYTAASQQVATAAEDPTSQVIYTGRYIAIFKQDATDAAISEFKDTHSLNVASASSFEGQAVSFEDLGAAEVLVFPSVGAALVSSEAYAAISSGSGPAIAEVGIASVPPPAPAPDPNSPIASYEAEFFVFAIDGGSDASSSATDAGTTATATAAAPTYGLDLTGVTQCGWMGNNIKVCILDTGFDLNHPDFAGRTIVSHSFVGQAVQDGNSHGTHTAGTACGPLDPGAGISRYGIAYAAQMYIGKVLTDAGTGTTSSILAGINWALANNCEVVSMSLRTVAPVQTSYTQAGTKALAQGTILIAAAGNDSQRPGTIAPTGAPANSPTFMSVAALDQNLDIAPFSNGGKVDIAGPGVGIFSSVPSPALHGTKSGTSMATPHVAGIAALWAESDPANRGQALWNALTGAAKPVTLQSSDVGAGMVQAPTSPAVSR
jgi:subtilisin family serine protease